jgi:pimeloyl-ACP methyl ester carboxylesterase
MRKKIGRFFGVLMIFLLLAYGVGRFIFPLQVVHYASVARVLWGGARHFKTAGEKPLEGWVRDFCDPADPEARGCTCIALIHGLGDSALTWTKLLTSKSSDWKRPVRLYALQIDRAGRFEDGDAPEDYRIHNQAHQIAHELKPLCSSFMVVGNSLGGWISAWMAMDQEIPIPKLVLSDTVGLKAVPTALSDLDGEVTLAKLQDFDRRAYFKQRDIPNNVWDHVYRKYKESNIPKIIQSQHSEDYLDGKLSNLKTPTMLIWGLSDQIAPVSGGRVFEKQIKGSLWRDLPNCGHIPQKECTQPYIADLNEMLMYGSM